VKIIIIIINIIIIILCVWFICININYIYSIIILSNCCDTSWTQNGFTDPTDL
jgi:hypothetical protein